MYMREMGTVELLTREGEIVIAKRIEEGLRELMKAMAIFRELLSSAKRIRLVDSEERRLNEIITGYLDNTDDEIPVSTPEDERPLKRAMRRFRPDSDDDEMKKEMSALILKLQRNDLQNYVNNMN
ncbi:MAG: hypothetical protein Ct9H300mP22_4500 [Gammaproteobacteria bacterium]|nr:MAG: hypothetical protein Ct9H300mP22_4500 [Gammaproteobacteria bacterium]